MALDREFHSYHGLSHNGISDIHIAEYDSFHQIVKLNCNRFREEKKNLWNMQMVPSNEQ